MLNQKRYVDITSGVGGGSGVATRQLILRVMTTNTLAAPGVVYEFEDPDDVMTFFGASSREYQRAVKMLGFISKSIRAPQKISFSRWVNVATAPAVYGDRTNKDLTTLKTYTAGKLIISINGTDVTVTPINLSTATTLTDVASLVQTALRANANPMLASNSTFTYNTNTAQFVLTGASVGAGKVSVKGDASATDLSVLLGLSTSSVTTSAGQNADAAVTAISKNASLNNNFGSFVFDLGGTALTDDDYLAVAAWNKTQNNMYLFCSQFKKSEVDDADRADFFATMLPIAGSGMSIVPDAYEDTDFADQMPAEILAATDYDSTNCTQDYMFYQFPNRHTAVTEDDDADKYDAMRMNYIGLTQTAGQLLAFYQRGTLCGGANDPTDMNTYANEMWFKDYIGAQMMSAFLSLPTVPANEIGQAMLLAIMQASVDKAKDNGVVSVGKTISTIQQLYITRLTGDETAWRQVATIGYWFTISFLSRVTTDGRTEWYAKYILVYGKDDAVRKVEGQNVLI